mmetsp:Transcript_27360/g.28462  ORF Transcript_27360/g.28462 Transcript_27360/m.28462 type:complete len:166 (-) Transcript_27360:48-545(-)
MTYNSQINIVESEFKEFFDYFKLELTTYREKSQLFDEYKEDYYKSYNNLKNKKEKLFALKNTHKWELDPNHAQDEVPFSDKTACFKIMCHADNVNLRKKLKKLGVCSYSLLNEMHKFKVYYGKQFHRHFSTLTMRNKDFLTEIVSIIKTLSINTERIKKSGEVDK